MCRSVRGGSSLRSDENCENYALAAKMNVIGKKKGGQVVSVQRERRDKDDH